MHVSANQSVLLTGAGGEIGRAVAARLVADGFQVIGLVKDDEDMATLTAAIPDAVPVQCNVRIASEVQEAVGQVEAALGGRHLSALINIAGINTNGPLIDLDPERFNAVLEVNLVGIHRITCAFLPLLRSDGGGRVVNMSSASGSRTMPFAGAYSASKFGLEALSQAMRLEFRPLGIHVSVIAPGVVNSPMSQDIVKDLEKPPSDPAYAEPLRRGVRLAEASIAKGVQRDRVVDLVVHAATAPKPKRRYEVHQDFVRDVVIMRWLPSGLRDKIVAGKFGL